MDLTKLSDADLLALQAKDYTKLSDEGLEYLHSGNQNVEQSNKPSNPDQGNMVGGLVGKGLEAYHNISQPVVNVVKKITPGISGLSKMDRDVETLTPNPLSMLAPAPLNSLIPLEKRTTSGAKVADEMARGMVDMAALGGVEKLVTKGVPATLDAMGKFGSKIPNGVRNVARSIEQMVNPATPFEQRMAGRKEQLISSLDSSLSSIERNIGENLVPKAKSAISRRVLSMEPEALKAIGLSDENIAIADSLKKKFGLTKLPTKTEGNQFFRKVVFDAPEDITVNPNNLSKTLEDIGHKLDPRDVRKIQSMITKTPSTTEAIMTGSGQSSKALSKDEYLQLREYLNSLSENGQNPFGHALKTALDYDAEKVIPQLSEAKGVFQLSREGAKAHRYLNNPKLEEQLQSELIKASNPSNVPTRDLLKSKVGNSADEILSELEKKQSLQSEFDKKMSNLESRSEKRDRLSQIKKSRQKVAKVAGAAVAIAGIPGVKKVSSVLGHLN